MENGNEEIVVVNEETFSNDNVQNEEDLRKVRKSLLKNTIIGGVSTLLLLIFSFIDKRNDLGLLNRLSSFRQDTVSSGFSMVLNKLIIITVIILCIFFILSFLLSIVALITKNKNHKNLFKLNDAINTSNMVPIILAIFVFIDAFFFSPVKVSGSSMQNTLQSEDLLITSHFYRNLDIDDIVIIEKLDKEDDFIIKRIVAKEGDKLMVTETGKVYVNDKVIEDSIGYRAIPKRIDETVLKEDEYFVLGDNRDISLDSRFYGIFNESQIVGKAVISLKPFKLKLGKEVKN